MTDAIITVSNLGKKYRIKHQAEKQRYTALRDVLANKMKGIFRNRGLEIGNQKLAEDFWALKDVSFEIKRGEVVGIIGRNGAGKSTLLKVLSRITEPTEGRVHLRGRVASLLEVGTGFHPELTGRENVFLNGAILGMSRAEIRKKFDEIVAFAEVEKFLDTPVKRYSSGMYVRLAFAVAAHLEPDILIVDEVLAVGDAAFQKKCLSKMNAIAGQSGRTILIVTHQLGILNGLASTGLFLEGGCLKMTGKASEVVEAYLVTSSFHASDNQNYDNRIRAVSIYANGHETQRAISFGDNIKIKLVVRRPHSTTWGINLDICKEDGSRLFLFSTQPHDGFSMPDSDEVSLNLEIPQFLPAPGDYIINIQITEPAIRILEQYDIVKRLTVTPVPKGGIWPYTQAFGSYFPAHRWSLAE